jgi:hypothetical protein
VICQLRHRYRAVCQPMMALFDAVYRQRGHLPITQAHGRQRLPDAPALAFYLL